MSERYDGLSLQELMTLADAEWAKDDTDFVKAYALYSRAGEKGNAQGALRAGIICYNGWGRERDYGQAKEWFEKAVSLGSAPACSRLGGLYHDGYGVPQDHKEAVRFYRLGSERGSAPSANNLGFMYENGLGVEKDYAQAERLYRKAAEAGNASAMYHLGDMAENGRGGKPDPEAARRWYELAVKKGNKKAPAALEALEKKIAAQKAAEEEKKKKTEAAKNGKPSISVGLIGPQGSGKTTLASAITKVLETNGGPTCFVPASELDSRPEEKEKGCTITSSFFEAESETAHFTMIDCPGDPRYRKNAISAAALMDAAILVAPLDYEDWNTDRIQFTNACLELRQQGVPAVAVFLNQCELTDDENDIGLREMELREYLESYGYDGDCTPVISGSAREALEDPSGVWGRKILELMNCLEEICIEQDRRADLPFFLPVKDVHYIPGRGTVAVGRVERGSVRVGSEVEIAGGEERQKTMVMNLRVFDKNVESAGPGDIVGVQLRGVSRDDVHRGMVLVSPGSARERRRFAAQIYVLKKEEGGRRWPFCSGYGPVFHFRTCTVPGVIRFGSDADYPGCFEGDSVQPGDNAVLVVELGRPALIEEGLRFLVTEGSSVVMTGVITAADL